MNREQKSKPVDVGLYEDKDGEFFLTVWSVTNIRSRVRPSLQIEWHSDASDVLGDRKTKENSLIHIPSNGKAFEKVQCYEPATMKY